MTSRFSKIIRTLLFAILALWAPAVAAQSLSTFTAPADGAINGSTTCTAPLVRNFTVGNIGFVFDVDLGVFAEHTWRGDIRITLQAPDGTRVQLVDGNTNSISGDNFNVRLDDAATQLVNTDSATGNQSNAAPPPFANRFRPNAALSAFNGTNAQGTWRMEICDQFPSQDNGNFRHAELYITAGPGTDLSLTKTLQGAAPPPGGSATYRLTVSNSARSAATATGVQVRDQLPAGFTFTSSTGSYNAATGIWTVGNVAPGASVSIDITGTVNATSGATITNTAEITAASALDPDSTPNNGATGEDDYASVSFTVAGTRVAGTPPVFTCPVGTSLFDWDARPWTAGSLNNSYTVNNIGTVGFNIATAGTWVNDPNFGGLSPALSNANNGGFAGAQLSLHQYLDFANRNEIATTTITLPTAVPGARFTIFDIDFAANDFADRLTVTGTNNGASVTPTLTNGRANYVIGNTAIGDALSGGTSGDGNVIVTFLQPVDTITIVYGNADTAPASPDGQAIAIHDITFCNPNAAVTVNKSSSIFSDPVNGEDNPKAIPGAITRYCILASNAGSGTATSVVVNDPLPANVTFIPGSLRTGVTCANATTVEDDNATGADESDPYGASFAGGTVAARSGSLTPSSSFAVAFQATVN